MLFGLESSPIAGMEGDSAPEPTLVERVRSSVSRKWQHWLDKSTVHLQARWGAFFVLLTLYFIRIYFINGWFIVTYGLGIYLLNIFIGFLTPQIDPELEQDDGPTLPSSNSEEFRPFHRRVPEFKFWYASFRATFIAFMMTFFSFFNVPVFWPLLLVYFCALFVLTMKRQIKHMWKHKYVPWSSGKQSYGGGGGGGGKGKLAK